MRRAVRATSKKRPNASCIAPLGKPRLHLGIGTDRVDLRVELVDDLGWRVARRADDSSEAKLIARYEFGTVVSASAGIGEALSVYSEHGQDPAVCFVGL
jgi:hypothetical protein